MPRARPEAITKPRGAEVVGQCLREFQTGAGGVAGADDGDHRPCQDVDVATYAEQRRRIVDHGQPRRIERLVWRHQADAKLFAGVELALSILLAADPAGPRGAAAPRQIGQPLKRRPGAAEMTDQGTESARPDIIGTDQPQPIEPSRVAEMRCVLGLDVHAAPVGELSRNSWMVTRLASNRTHTRHSPMRNRASPMRRGG
jgi:hypothetical protein